MGEGRRTFPQLLLFSLIYLFLFNIRQVLPEGFSKCTDYAEGLTATSRYDDIPYTPGESFTVILDGFIISDNVSCEYVQNIETGYEYTDHNPVVLKFILKP